MADESLDKAKRLLWKRAQQEKRAQQISDIEATAGFARIFGPLRRLQGIALFGWIARVLRWVLRLWVRVFRWTAYVGTPPRLVPWRAGLTGLVLLLITLWMPWYMVRNVIPFTGKLVYDLALLSTTREETLIFGDPDLIDDASLLYEVQACESLESCTADTSRVFRIRQSTLLNAVSWFQRGRGYDASQVAAAFWAERNECQFTYYGFRVRAFGFYPFIREATCRAL